MAGGINIQVFGDKALAKKLNALPDALEKKIVRKAMRQGIKPVAAAAKANAPVLSGLLQLSLKVGARKFKNRHQFGVQVSTAGISGVELFYAAYQEFGTSHQPAKPFIRPALYGNEGTVLSTMKREIGTGIEAAAR